MESAIISDFGFRIEKHKLDIRNSALSPQSAFRIPKSAIELLHYSNSLQNPRSDE